MFAAGVNGAETLMLTLVFPVVRGVKFAVALLVPGAMTAGDWIVPTAVLEEVTVTLIPAVYEPLSCWICR